MPQLAAPATAAWHQLENVHCTAILRVLRQASVQDILDHIVAKRAQVHQQELRVHSVSCYQASSSWFSKLQNDARKLLSERDFLFVDSSAAKRG